MELIGGSIVKPVMESAGDLLAKYGLKEIAEEADAPGQANARSEDLPDGLRSMWAG